MIEIGVSFHNSTSIKFFITFFLQTKQSLFSFSSLPQEAKYAKNYFICVVGTWCKLDYLAVIKQTHPSDQSVCHWNSISEMYHVISIGASTGRGKLSEQALCFLCSPLRQTANRALGSRGCLSAITKRTLLFDIKNSEGSAWESSVLSLLLTVVQASFDFVIFLPQRPI